MKGTHVMRSAPHHNEFETEPPTPFLVSNSCFESVKILKPLVDQPKLHIDTPTNVLYQPSQRREIPATEFGYLRILLGGFVYYNEKN